MSCSWCIAWITEPAPKEQQRLEERVGHQVENSRVVGTNASGKEHVPQLRTGRVGDHALDVELRQAHRRGKDRVSAPITVTKSRPAAQASNIGERRATMNTPAVTMVAAWISAETGVGPSIASGSQVCSRNCADLPMAPMNSSAVTHDVSTVSKDMPRMTRQRVVRIDVTAISRTPSRRTRTNRSARMPKDTQRKAKITHAVDDKRLHRRGVGRWACGYQKPISKYELSPTPSQPKNSWIRLSAVTSISMAKVKRLKYAWNRGIDLSSAM